MRSSRHQRHRRSTAASMARSRPPSPTTRTSRRRVSCTTGRPHPAGTRYGRHPQGVAGARERIAAATLRDWMSATVACRYAACCLFAAMLREGLRCNTHGTLLRHGAVRTARWCVPCLPREDSHAQMSGACDAVRRPSGTPHRHGHVVHATAAAAAAACGMRHAACLLRRGFRVRSARVRSSSGSAHARI
jgi:hypothetical protein